MAQTEQTEVQKTEDKAKDSKGKVADYLAAPRKKRKSYVLMAMSPQVRDQFASGIESMLRVNFKGVAIATPKSAEELTKNFSRQIVLLVFDDEFVTLDAGLKIIEDLKRRKNQSAVPVLFLTRRPAQLVEAYNAMLAPFHETDDYIDYAKVDIAHIYSKIRHGLAAKNRRRGRRYVVDIPLAYFLLSNEGPQKGRLLDLSVHGALIKSEANRIFTPGEQMKLHLPVTAYLPPVEGDYLKLSARVRRVFIAGSQAGISFEHVSNDRMTMLTRFLTEMVNDQNMRRSQALRAKARA